MEFLAREMIALFQRRDGRQPVGPAWQVMNRLNYGHVRPPMLSYRAPPRPLSRFSVCRGQYLAQHFIFVRQRGLPEPCGLHPEARDDVGVNLPFADTHVFVLAVLPKPVT